MRVLAAAVMIALLATSAGPGGVHTDREGARVLPLPKEEGVFHFLVFGDRTGGPAQGIEVLKTAVRDANLLGPDLVMTVGDMVQGYNQTEEWTTQMREYRGVMEGLDMPWFPVAGNHDVYWRGSPAPPGQHERSFEAHFGPLWYWFAHKNAAFIVLYTDEGNPETGRKGFNRPDLIKFSERQLAWLKKTLVATRRFDHVFLFMHHPRWIVGGYPGTNWDAVHGMLKAARNVTLVIGGHIHRMRYEGRRDGIEYLTLATTGGKIPYDVPGTGFLHHMNLVTVRKGRVTMAAIPVGAVIDPKAMTPEHMADVAKAQILPMKSHGPVVAVEPDASGRGRVTYTIENPAIRPIEVTLTTPNSSREWHVFPNHVHLRLDPGATKDVGFMFTRQGDDFAGFAVPRLGVQVDYLAEDRRISLPEITVVVPTRMEFGDADHSAKHDRVAVLDGKSACLSVASGLVALPDATPFTVEAWIRPESLGRIRSVVGKTEASEFLLALDAGRPQFLVHIGEAYVVVRAEKRVRVGAWTHLAGVRDGKEVRLYVDGTRVAKAPAEGPRTLNTMPIYIGAEPDASGRPTRFFHGRIDEVRISAIARYAGESFAPAPRFEPDDDTRLLLHLDVIRGPFTPDESRSLAPATGRGSVVHEIASIEPGK